MLVRHQIPWDRCNEVVKTISEKLPLLQRLKTMIIMMGQKDYHANSPYQRKQITFSKISSIDPCRKHASPLRQIFKTLSISAERNIPYGTNQNYWRCSRSKSVIGRNKNLFRNSHGGMCPVSSIVRPPNMNAWSTLRGVGRYSFVQMNHRIIFHFSVIAPNIPALKAKRSPK